MRYWILFAISISLAFSADFTTYIGDQFAYSASAIALDASGNIWVGGSTTSANFPLHDALLDSSPGNGFLVKLAPDGTVVYSSYFYGPVNGLATDASGNVYLTGSTYFDGFPTTPGLPTGPVSSDGVYRVSGAFVTKLDPGDDAFITGYTNTTDLPVTSGELAGSGGFAAKIHAAGNQLVYLTYLSSGGPPESGISTDPTGIAADASGNAYITGFTNDPAFPATAGAFQTALKAAGQSTNAFAMKLNPSGSTAWATFFGGPGPDGANSIALEGSTNNVWLTGTNAVGFPSEFTGLGFTTAAGDFAVELSADGSKLLDSMELPMAGQALAFDPSGLLHLASQTALISTMTLGQPPTPRIIGIMNAAQGPISGRIAPSEIISIYGFGLGPTTPATAAPANGVFPTSLGGVQVLVNGTPIPYSTYPTRKSTPKFHRR